MELVTPVGIVLALVAIAVAFVLEGGSPAVAFSNPAAILLVLGGTWGVGLASTRTRDVSGVLRASLSVLLPRRQTAGPAAAVARLSALAETARRDGLLALDGPASQEEDPFLRRGLQLVVDGKDSEQLVRLLEDDLDAMQARHRVASGFHTQCSAYAPAVGIVGTVLGLTLALGHVDDPSAMGHSVGAAFLATLWGIGTANCLHLPIASALKRASAIEVQHRRMLLEALVALQAGAGPRGLREAVDGFLAPAEREAVAQAVRAA